MVGRHITFTTDSKVYKGTYSSTILDVRDNLMTISMPYHNGALVLPGVGTRLYATMLPMEKTDTMVAKDAVVTTYNGGQSFECEIVERNIVKKYLRISTPYSISRSSGTRQESLAKVIAITSGKGGVGKTSFAINFALALSNMGKRVLIFDADLGMANVDVLLNIKPEFDIADVISGNTSIQDITVKYPGGISFIPGASGIQQLAYLTDSQFNRIISGFNEIEKDYDYMIIDTGAGLSKNVTNFLMASDEIYLVTTTEPHAIMDAYSIVKVMTDLNANKKINLIVNRSESVSEALSVAKKMQNTCKRFLNVDIIYLGHILDDKNVSRSIKSRTPLIIYNPDSNASRCIRKIADAAAYRIQPQCDTPGIAGFFSRLKKCFQL